MAFIIRAALVVGAIYMLSPIRSDEPAVRPQDLAAEAARMAATKAMEACAAHPETCARLAAGAAALHPSVAAPPSGGPAIPMPPLSLIHI